MKYIKTISCLILFAISFSVSAEIKLRSSAPNLRPEYRVRTVTPNFSVNDTKHNQRINNTTNDYVIHKTDVSYLSIEDNQYTTSSRRNRMTGKNTNYYQRYSPVYSQSSNVSYNNHITVKAYNVANRTPFEGDASVKTSSSQYSQFGPPEEGPIGDVIWPLLLCIGIYILGKTKK